jgi:hypothetical protein
MLETFVFSSPIEKSGRENNIDMDRRKFDVWGLGLCGYVSGLVANSCEHRNNLQIKIRKCMNSVRVLARSIHLYLWHFTVLTKVVWRSHASHFAQNAWRMRLRRKYPLSLIYISRNFILSTNFSETSKHHFSWKSVQKFLSCFERSDRQAEEIILVCAPHGCEYVYEVRTL